MWAGGWTKTYASITFEDGVYFTAVDDLSQRSLSAEIYPNPITDNAAVRFSNPDNEAFEFELYNMTGQRMRAIRGITSSEFSLEKGDLEIGIYLYVLRSQSTKMTGKILMK